MKNIELTVHETVRHAVVITVPDDFDLDDPSDEHRDAIERLFEDQHELFQEDYTERDYFYEDAPVRSIPRVELEVE